MILVILDTNTYLRIAKRIRPAIGFTFGQKDYWVSIPKIVEDEVQRSPRLQSVFPWFGQEVFSDERRKHCLKLKPKQKKRLNLEQALFMEPYYKT